MKDFTDRLSSLSPEQRALFESRLKKKSANRPQTGASKAGSIPKRKRLNNCLLSFDQERIWIIDQMEPGNPAYNIYSASRLLGPLSREAWKRAINEMVRRYEILRTTFSTIDGEPVMVILPELTIEVAFEDASHFPPNRRLVETVRMINEATAQPFDLKKGPLLRVGFIKLDEEDHAVHLTMHHTITDRWSADVLDQETAAIYSAFLDDKPSPLPPVDIQFADFAEWQREYLQDEVLAAKVDYWKEQLAGAPLVLNLPTDRPRPPVQTFRGARELIRLPEPLLQGLKSLTQRDGATMFMTLLAAYNLLVYRYTGQEDILIGLAMANRNRPETVNMLGYLLNMVILRAKFSSTTSFRELLGIVRKSAVGAFANLDLPLGKLIEELKPPPDLSRNPIFQIAYIYLDFPTEAGVEDPKVKPMPLEVDNGASRFDMTLALTELPDHLETLIEFNTDIFDHETMQRMLQHLRVLLEGVVSNPDCALSELPIFTSAENEQLREVWNNATADFPRDRCVQQLAELAVNQAADSVAVASGDSQITYAELNARANKIEHYLRTLGVAAESRVAVCLTRSPELIAVLLGILKAGAAYVPVDPGYPVDRISHILEDSFCHIVISEEALIDFLPSHWGVTISIDRDFHSLDEQCADDPRLDLDPDSAAYVIYTSGSTGAPRGVSVPHRAINRLALNSNYVSLTPDSVMAQCSSASFDAATFEIWGALLNGCRLVIIDKDVALSPREFSEQIRSRSVTVLFLTTALFNEVARHSPHTFRSVQYLLFGGEAVTPDWVKLIVEGGCPEHFLHVYGPTENTTFSSFFQVGPVTNGDTIPIGLPISNTLIHVVDRSLNPLPAGIDGELLIGGDGLAHCYLNRPILTAEKFTPDPFAESPGQRLYRSGDLVRRRQDGNIVFIGRNDFQVKIRGFRVELEEVESVIKRHPVVVDAVVAVTADPGKERRLVAYIVPRPGLELTISELRRFMTERLPEYMAPSVLVQIDNLPLTTNGKIDRSKLPDPGQARPDMDLEFVGPRTQIEHALCEAWARVLGLDNVGIRDNFFDLGGDSIRSIQIMSRSEEAGCAFSIQELFQNPTIESLAAIVESRDGRPKINAPAEPFSLVKERDRALLPESIEDAYPLTMLQAGMIFHSELSPSTAVYHDIFSFHLQSRLDPEMMRESLKLVISRHPVLRTSFRLIGPDHPLQLVHKEVEAPLHFEDISHLDVPQQRAFVGTLIQSEKSTGFSWDRPPLLRLWVHKRSVGSFQFTLSFHHAILDGWSLATMLAELFESYLARLEGRTETPQATSNTSFRDFVALEIEAVNSDDCRQFWIERLDQAPFTAIPRSASSGRQAEPLGEIGVCMLEVTDQLSGMLNSLSRSLGVPLKSVLLAGHAKVLALINGQNEIVTGTVSNGRPEERDAERVLGLFLNTLPLRIRLQAADTWGELALAAFAAETQTLRYRRYPMAEMQKITGRNPMLEVAFNYTHFHAVNGVLGVKGIEILEDLSISETNFPFLVDFNLDPGSSTLQAAIKYDKALFDDEQIELIAGYYLRAFRAMAERHGAGHASRPLLSHAEIDWLVCGFNRTENNYGAFRSVHEMVREQSERVPDTIALISGESHFSHEVVNRKANQLANYLVRQRASPERLIGIALDRSASMCIALLAILKTGAAYVPLDPAFPWARLKTMIEGVELLLTQSSYADRFTEPGIQSAPVLRLDELEDAVSTESGQALFHQVDPENLVYVIFTSGSTGAPKGVALTHRVATNLIRWTHSILAPGRNTLQFASLSFDIAFQEVFSTWTSGGTLVLISDEDRRDALTLTRLVRDRQVDRLFLPAVVLQQFAGQVMLEEQAAGAVPEVITAGEQLKVSHQVRRLFNGQNGRILHNHYGPSETHVATAFRLDEQPDSWPDLPPIGEPIHNAKVYLLNENLELAPAGTPAEIFIGGDILARGYLNRPELTAQKFLCDPFREDGSRLYRSGDMGRLRADIQIEFLGRLDHQVKVRGFRVELGEIESTLGSNPAITQAVVSAFNDGSGGNRLVAFVVPVSVDHIDARVLTEFLRDRLPDYMIPSQFVLLEKLPVTATGKVDRRALHPPSESAATSSAGYVRPATSTEEAVSRIWSEILGRPEISTRDNFFDLGGHSLIANQIVSRIRLSFGSEIPLKALFDRPTIAQLSAYIETGLTTFRAVRAEQITTSARGDSCTLSIAQRRLWFLEQLDPHRGAYHIAISLSLGGNLSVSALEQAIAEIVRRHEVLRSRIFEADGTPLQSVEQHSPVLNSLDLTALNGRHRAESARGLISILHSRIFDMAEAPLMRSWVVRVADREHVLAVTLHHLISDGWSMGIFNDELVRLYEFYSAGAPSALEDLPIQYRDFAVWQSDLSKSERFELEVSYWKHQLGGRLPVLDIPSDHTRPASRTFKGSTVSYRLDADARNALKEIAHGEGATPFMAYLASFLSLLSRYTGQSDVIIGAPVSGRNRAEIEPLIGCFVNTLVLRATVSGATTLRGMISQVRQTALEAYANQDVPFELLVEELQPERNAARSPIFDVMFDLQNEAVFHPLVGNLQLTQFQHDATASKFDLTVSITDSSTDPVISVEFSTDLFERETIDRLISAFNLLIRSGVTMPDRAIAQLALVRDEELRQILEVFGDASCPYPSESCIYDLFDHEAGRHPDSIALVFEHENVTFEFLNSRADGLSRLLISKGITTESKVGIRLPRSIELIVSLLAVLKAGGAYVPMDASYPASRLEFMASDSQADLLLTLSGMLGSDPAATGRVICLDRDGYDSEVGRPAGPAGRAFPESLAYVIYTSGTTGTPKGVAVTHRGVVRLVKGANYAELNDQQVFLQLSTVSFDVATFEIWGSLLNGAKLVLMPDQMASLEDIERAISLYGVTVLWLTAGLFHLMVDRRLEALGPVRQLLAGGEALQADHVNRFLAGDCSGTLINGYGPTEVTTFTCSYRFKEPLDTSRAVLIGRPISNTSVYLLDSEMNPVVLGVRGQIHASGPGLARCYLNNPDLTAKRFMPNPFSRSGGERMYATGDLGSYLKEGNIEFLGRLDSQVKLRGFRIELGEIESVLADCPGVSQALVAVRADESGEKRLVAYATSKDGATLEAVELRERVKTALPDFMVPSAFVILDTLPLTRSGKVDYHALPAPVQNTAKQKETFEPPRNLIEEGLVRIWTTVLGRKHIGIHDDFFELGGHSLLATQVASRIRETFEIEFPLRSLFENRDIARLGEAVETLLLDKVDALSEEEAANLLG